MTVRVKIYKGDPRDESNWDVIPGGETFKIEDGHLLVGGGGDRVAAFAPESWFAVESVERSRRA